MFTVVSAEATDESHPAHEYFRRRSQVVIALMRTGLEQAAARGLLEALLTAPAPAAPRAGG